MTDHPDLPPPGGRVPMAMRDDFCDLARLGGYSPQEIEDFLDGRTLAGHDALPDACDGHVTWKSLEAIRIECVDYLASREALAAVARSGAAVGEGEVSRGDGAAYPADVPSLRADPELHAQALARALEQRGARARRG